MSRIVVAASPLSGPVLPMAQIGCRLKGRGHAVTMLPDEKHRRVVEHFGLDFVPLRPGYQSASSASLTPHVVAMPRLVRRYLQGRADTRSTFVAPFVAQYRALQGRLDIETADAVLVNVAFTGALPLLTSQPPRPAVLVCGVGPLTLSSADTAPFGMGWIPRPEMDYHEMHSVVHRTC